MKQLALLGIVLSLLYAPCLFGEDQAPTVTTGAAKAFVDRDGDGFDDQAGDRDGDGIPDSAEREKPASQPQEQPAEFGMFAAAQTMIGTTPVFLHNSGSFNHLKLLLNPLTQHRGGFGVGVDFGPGGDIGCGAVMGGACAGGACGP